MAEKDYGVKWNNFYYYVITDHACVKTEMFVQIFSDLTEKLDSDILQR